jgi:hypothetical protein
LVRTARSWVAWASIRSARQSAEFTACSVPRIIVARTARRLVSSSTSSAGRNPSRRDQRP